MADERANVRRILLCTHPILRRKAQTVKRVDRALRKLLDEMVETMQAAPGLGLAAPQVGESLRCCVVATPDDGAVRKLINPRITSRQGKVTGAEGCLSFPTLQGLVQRAQKVTVKALDERMRPQTFEAEGLYARAIQHELDHLDGVLFIDRVLDGQLAWQVPDDNEEDGYRLEPVTVEEALEFFSRLAEERGEEV